MDEQSGSNVVDVGVDLSEFYMSVEWDILEVPAVRNEKFYTCCDEPYLDITFNITMRRKTLFYTVNIIIPCMGISFLTVLTFYLPSDSGEKVTLSISILISLHVFFLLVVEIIPPTSLVVPLLGKYLIFAMILVSIRTLGSALRTLSIPFTLIHNWEIGKVVVNGVTGPKDSDFYTTVDYSCKNVLKNSVARRSSHETNRLNTECSKNTGASRKEVIPYVEED
ncbi:Acetylcholine receptor subunit alpha-like [Habropoda laboriosa]|uniref:Acetylcholine receptor subunit alpha-like n=1 Tax=Habropoda laboriosa TaxID=597456 RepID=A0A0L7RE60_9HYME|nr:Acetylcholine receptor subunit alpha-like [Habropoda laboriosa]